MATRRIAHRPTSEQAAGDALSRIKTAQAATWLLEELHIRELWSDDAFINRDDYQSPDEIRTQLTWIAIEALAAELSEARRELEEAAAPKAVA